MKAVIRSDLPASTEEVWRTLLKTETFLFITRGMLGFSGSEAWPERFHEGMEIQTRLWFFHVVPGWKHSLNVVRVDHGETVIESKEGGGLVSRWDHRIQLHETAEGRCRYADLLTIEAGVATWFVWAFAHLFYRYRQRRWRKLLQTRISS